MLHSGHGAHTRSLRVHPVRGGNKPLPLPARTPPARPQGLLSAHERQEASSADLRQKVRALRQELEAREKALELARRTVERLTGEKGHLEAGAAGALGWPLARLAAGWLATVCGLRPAPLPCQLSMLLLLLLALALSASKSCAPEQPQQPHWPPAPVWLRHAGTQAYVRKLEARLLAVRHSAELQQRCVHYKSQVGGLSLAAAACGS